MKPSELRTNDELLAEMVRSDPEFRAKWERTATARTLALAIVRYRADNGLTQHELAELVGLPISEILRLELGEVTPPGDVLVKMRALL